MFIRRRVRRLRRDWGTIRGCCPRSMPGISLASRCASLRSWDNQPPPARGGGPGLHGARAYGTRFGRLEAWSALQEERIRNLLSWYLEPGSRPNRFRLLTRTPSAGGATDSGPRVERALPREFTIWGRPLAGAANAHQRSLGPRRPACDPTPACPDPRKAAAIPPADDPYIAPEPGSLSATIAPWCW